MTDWQNTKTRLPGWLSSPEAYVAPNSRERYLDKTLLSLTSLLAHFRLNTNGLGAYAPSPLPKFIGLIALIVLNSLSHNYFFTLILLALVLLRVAVLDAKALRMTASVAATATVISFIVMLPAALVGQGHSALLIATKTLVSTSLVMTVATTTPQSDISATLRQLRLPEVFVTTFDLTIKSIISLGETALEMTTALKLRSVGRNRQKGSAIGGIGGMLFLKSKEESEATYEAMLCRCYDPSSRIMGKKVFKAFDLVWVVVFAAIVVAFVYFQGVV